MKNKKEKLCNMFQAISLLKYLFKIRKSSQKIFKKKTPDRKREKEDDEEAGMKIVAEENSDFFYPTPRSYYKAICNNV